MNGVPTDAIMTPDLRFTVAPSARSTCACALPATATPASRVAATKRPARRDRRLRHRDVRADAGQHVLFEHGSIHDVVDRETSPCGCPDPKGLSLADAMLVKPAAAAPKAGPKPETKAVAAPPIEVQHPFPQPSAKDSRRRKKGRRQPRSLRNSPTRWSTTALPTIPTRCRRKTNSVRHPNRSQSRRPLRRPFRRRPFRLRRRSSPDPAAARSRAGSGSRARTRDARSRSHAGAPSRHGARRRPLLPQALRRPLAAQTGSFSAS